MWTPTNSWEQWCIHYGVFHEYMGRHCRCSIYHQSVVIRFTKSTGVLYLRRMNRDEYISCIDRGTLSWLLGPVEQYKIGLPSDGGLDTSMKTWVAGTVLNSSMVTHTYKPIIPGYLGSSRILILFHVDIFIWFICASFVGHFSQGANKLLKWQQKNALAHSNLRAFVFMVFSQ